MTKLQWLILWFIFLGYLCLGAFIFYQIERKLEETLLIKEIKDIENPANKIQDIFFNHFKTDLRMASQIKVIEKINFFCNKTLFDLKDIVAEEADSEYRWTYYNSFFFALTTLSTIGYGNLHPSTSLGRIMVILYALIGIPLNGIVLTKLGELFSSTFLTVHHRYKAERYESRVEMTMDIILYLIPGIVLFIFVPSVVLTYYEGWSFDESIYFAFVTLTTIGYGDLVAGQTTNSKQFYSVYKIFLIFWIMIGLGYLVMILGFISRAMRCQQMSKLEQKLSQNLRLTQSKIWNEFNKDITYVRRMLNEMYLIKFRPVYKEKSKLRARSQSCPNLSEWPKLRKIIEKGISAAPSFDEEEMVKQFQNQRMKRRTGIGENMIKPKILKITSEGDLSKIDRIATFGNTPAIEPSELLARVVDALGTTCGLSSVSAGSSRSSLSSLGADDYLRKKYENGIHGFTDEEILASEVYHDAQKTLYNMPLHRLPNPSYHNQWTWAGPPNPSMNRNNLNTKKRTNSIRPDERSHLSVPHVRGLRRMSIAAMNFISNSASKTHTWFCNTPRRGSVNPDPECGNMETHFDKSRKNSKTHVHRLSLPSENYGSMDTEENRFARRASILGILANQIGPPRDFLSNQNISNPVLEHTTLSDFLRIIDSVHHNAPTYAQRGDTIYTENEVHDRQPSHLISLFQNHPSQEKEIQTKQNYSKNPISPTSSTSQPQPITSCLINQNNPQSARKRRQSLSPMSVNWYPTVQTPKNRRASLAFMHNTPSPGFSHLQAVHENRKRSKSSSNINTPIPSTSSCVSPPTRSSTRPITLSPPKIFVVTPGQTSRRIRRFSVRQCNVDVIPYSGHPQKKNE